MDELKYRRQKKCAESPQGHELVEEEMYVICLHCDIVIYKESVS